MITLRSVMDRAPVHRQSAPLPVDIVPLPNFYPSAPARLAEVPILRRARVGHRAPLPHRVIRSLLILAPLNIAAGMNSLAVTRGDFTCDSALCTASTLGQHSRVTLILSTSYLAALLLMAVLTRGFSQAGPVHAAAVGILFVVGTSASAGIVLAFVAVAAAVTAAATLIFLFLLTTGRFGPTSLDG